jgi:hypothetical protein
MITTTGLSNDATDECIAFHGNQCLARGPLAEVVSAAQTARANCSDKPIVVLRAASAEIVEWDNIGGVTNPRPEQDSKKAACGRPKLGVTAREVTLLPRHWEWLGKAPSGASAKLRELVEAAMRSTSEKDRRREAFEAVERFTNAVAGNLENAENVARALYAGRLDDVACLTANWPNAVRAYYLELAAKTVPKEQ